MEHLMFIQSVQSLGDFSSMLPTLIFAVAAHKTAGAAYGFYLWYAAEAIVCSVGSGGLVYYFMTQTGNAEEHAATQEMTIYQKESLAAATQLLSKVTDHAVRLQKDRMEN